MADFVKICKTTDIPEGERREFEFEEETIIVLNVEGAFYAIADLCTHDGGSLDEGEVVGCEIECPRHGALFDIRTGAATRLPAVTPIPIYQVKTEGDDLYVEDPDAW